MRKIYTRSIFTLLLLCIGWLAEAQVSGKVFFDANNNGIQDTRDRGMPNITVRAYNALNEEIAKATTDTLGAYNLVIPTGKRVRIEFGTSRFFDTYAAKEGNTLSSVQRT